MNYHEYEIIYDVKGETHRGWYRFYPLPDPEETIKGKQIQIKCNKRRPYLFKVAEEENTD